jgi:hypothetical protein
LRRTSALAAAVLTGSLLALTIQTPAFAGKGVVASVESGVGCDAGQNATSVQVTMTEVPQGQRISVRTDAYDLVRGHVSYSGGVAKYNVELGGRLNKSQPATAWVTNDGWNGTFRVTGVTCREAAPAALNTQQTANCPEAAQIAVSVANPNSVRTVYEVGGNLPTREVALLAGESTTLTYSAERGESYRITASGNDGTRSYTRITVAGCATPEQPNTSTTTSPTTTSPGIPGIPSVPGATVGTTVPGVTLPTSTTPTAASSAPSPNGSASSQASSGSPASSSASGQSSSATAVTLASGDEPTAEPSSETGFVGRTYEVVASGTTEVASTWWFWPIVLALLFAAFHLVRKRMKRTE